MSENQDATVATIIPNEESIESLNARLEEANKTASNWRDNYYTLSSQHRVSCAQVEQFFEAKFEEDDFDIDEEPYASLASAFDISKDIEIEVSVVINYSATVTVPRGSITERQFEDLVEVHNGEIVVGEYSVGYTTEDTERVDIDGF